jgi:hypothetical protein
MAACPGCCLLILGGFCSRTISTAACCCCLLGWLRLRQACQLIQQQRESTQQLLHLVSIPVDTLQV